MSSAVENLKKIAGSADTAPQRSEEWHTRRKTCIGGSEIHKFITAKSTFSIIQGKLGLGSKFHGNLFTLHGTFFEDVAACYIKLKCIGDSGKYIPTTYDCGNLPGIHKFQRYSPDGFMITNTSVIGEGDEPVLVLLEYKSPFSRIPGFTVQPQYVSQIQAGLASIPQCDHALFVDCSFRICDFADLAFDNPDYNKLIHPKDSKIRGLDTDPDNGNKARRSKASKAEAKTNLELLGALRIRVKADSTCTNPDYLFAVARAMVNVHKDALNQDDMVAIYRHAENGHMEISHLCVNSTSPFEKADRAESPNLDGINPDFPLASSSRVPRQKMASLKSRITKSRTKNQAAIDKLWSDVFKFSQAEEPFCINLPKCWFYIPWKMVHSSVIRVDRDPNFAKTLLEKLEAFSEEFSRALSLSEEDAYDLYSGASLGEENFHVATVAPEQAELSDSDSDSD